ncbi:MAG TPA: hypothetical protein ENK43_06480 [Planctomycetes bacterium]|nr:hypothetical protein [Planctomycetota bacterium]
MVEKKVAKSSDWESSLGRPEPVCTACGAAFEPGSEFINQMFIVEGRPERRVYCLACHEQVTEEPFAFWRSKVPMPEAGKPRPLDLEFLAELFRRLHGDQVDPSHDEVRYIVTLLLIRKKVLVQEGNDEEGEGDAKCEIMLTRFAKEKEGPIYRTPVPLITAERMDVIRDDLGRIFNLQS